MVDTYEAANITSDYLDPNISASSARKQLQVAPNPTQPVDKILKAFIEKPTTAARVTLFGQLTGPGIGDKDKPTSSVFLQIMTSPLERHREMLPKHDAFRKALFADPNTGKTHFLNMLKMLATNQNSKALQRDFRNLLLYMLQHPETQAVLFAAPAKFAQQLIQKGRVDACPDTDNLQSILGDKFALLSKEFILQHLTTEERDRFNLFRRFKKPERRDFLQHKNRKALKYSKDAIITILSAVPDEKAAGNEVAPAPVAAAQSASNKNQQQLIRCIHFFRRDAHRALEWQRSGLLKDAVNDVDQNQPNALAPRLNALLFASTEQPSAQEANMLAFVKTNAWDDVYNQGFNITELCKINLFHHERLKKLRAAQDAAKTELDRQKQAYAGRNPGFWKWWNNKDDWTRNVVPSINIYATVSRLVKIFKSWFSKWVSKKYEFTIWVEQRGVIKEKKVRASKQEHFAQAIVNPAAYDSNLHFATTAAPALSATQATDIATNRTALIQMTAATAIAGSIFTKPLLGKLFNVEQPNYVDAVSIFANEDPHYRQWILQNDKPADAGLRHACRIGLITNGLITEAGLSTFDLLTQEFIKPQPNDSAANPSVITLLVKAAPATLHDLITKVYANPSVLAKPMLDKLKADATFQAKVVAAAQHVAVASLQEYADDNPELIKIPGYQLALINNAESLTTLLESAQSYPVIETHAVYPTRLLALATEALQEIGEDNNSDPKYIAALNLAANQLPEPKVVKLVNYANRRADPNQFLTSQVEYRTVMLAAIRQLPDVTEIESLITHYAWLIASADFNACWLEVAQKSTLPDLIAAGNNRQTLQQNAAYVAIIEAKAKTANLSFAQLAEYAKNQWLNLTFKPLLQAAAASIFSGQQALTLDYISELVDAAESLSLIDIIKFANQHRRLQLNTAWQNLIVRKAANNILFDVLKQYEQEYSWLAQVKGTETRFVKVVAMASTDLEQYLDYVDTHLDLAGDDSEKLLAEKINGKSFLELMRVATSKPTRQWLLQRSAIFKERLIELAKDMEWLPLAEQLHNCVTLQEAHYKDLHKKLIKKLPKPYANLAEQAGLAWETIKNLLMDDALSIDKPALEKAFTLMVDLPEVLTIEHFRVRLAPAIRTHLNPSDQNQKKFTTKLNVEQAILNMGRLLDYNTMTMQQLVDLGAMYKSFYNNPAFRTVVFEKHQARSLPFSGLLKLIYSKPLLPHRWLLEDDAFMQLANKERFISLLNGADQYRTLLSLKKYFNLLHTKAADEALTLEVFLEAIYPIGQTPRNWLLNPEFQSVLQTKANRANVRELAEFYEFNSKTIIPRLKKDFPILDFPSLIQAKKQAAAKAKSMQPSATPPAVSDPSLAPPTTTVMVAGPNAEPHHSAADVATQLKPDDSKWDNLTRLFSGKAPLPATQGVAATRAAVLNPPGRARAASASAKPAPPQPTTGAPPKPWWA